MKKPFLVLTGVFCLCTQYKAETDLNQLKTAKSFKCDFTTAVSTEWKNGKAIITSNEKNNLTLHFDSIDTKQGTARMIGNQAATDVHAILTRETLNFLGQTPSGNLIMTTIFRFKQNNNFTAVTSRHMDLYGKPTTITILRDLQSLGLSQNDHLPPEHFVVD